MRRVAIAYPLPGHNATDPVHQRDIDRRWVDWFKTHFDTPPTTQSSGRQRLVSS